MKTTRHHDDGIEWLRQVRRKVADQCGHDLEKQSAVYRRAAAKHSFKVYQGDAPKKRLKLAA